MRKPFLVGIAGSNRDDSPVLAEARLLGEEIARRGHVLVTGGGPGVMRAASEGAFRAGGLVIGILPNERRSPREDYPNPFIDIHLYTGMGEARNAIFAKTVNVLIALKGGAGTLSEMALARKSGTPVIAVSSPGFDIPGGLGIKIVNSAEDALLELDRILDLLSSR